MKIKLTFFFCLLLQFAWAQQQDSLPHKDSAAFNRLQNLSAVIVKDKRPFVEMRADKIILNVQSNIVAASGSVFEILQGAPGVTVSNDETINLAGKSGVNILIDGRPTQLSGKELAMYLKGLPGSTVDKIEIITNPSAKYDAQGSSGIINIKLKKNNNGGFNGNLALSYVQAVHPNINFSSGLNIKRGSWSSYLRISARKWQQHTDGAINRYVVDGTVAKKFANRTVDEDASTNINIQAGADWRMNKKNSVGIIVQGNEYKSRLYTPGNTFISVKDIIDSSLRTINDNRQRTSRYTANLNYSYADTLGTELSIDADYGYYHNKSRGQVNTEMLDAAFTTYDAFSNNQDVATAINIYGIKADFVKPLKKQQAKIEAGVKWSITETSNNLRAFLISNSVLQADTGRTNNFTYSEAIAAAYGSYNQKLGKWELQLGLRAERPVIKGRSRDLRGRQISYPDTAYISLFPDFFLRWEINDKHSAGLSFSRRINRPSYQDLNPFEYIYDNYSRESGNPYLQPEFSNNMELSYSYRGALNIVAGYSITSNAIKSISTQKGQQTLATNYNIGKEDRWYLNLSLGMPVTKWWDLYINLTPGYRHFRGVLPAGILDNSAWGMNWYCSQNFSLPSKWKLQLSSWGNTATRDGMARTAWLGSLDAGVSKSFLKEKLSLRVALTDIFNTQRWQQQVDFGNVQYNYTRKWESRNLRVQLNWKFGKPAVKLKERESGASDEMKRIR